MRKIALGELNVMKTTTSYLNEIQKERFRYENVRHAPQSCGAEGKETF